MVYTTHMKHESINKAVLEQIVLRETQNLLDQQLCRQKALRLRYRLLSVVDTALTRLEAGDMVSSESLAALRQFHELTKLT